MPQDHPDGTLQAMALYLARNIDRIRRHQAAPDIAREITAAVHQATRIIDRPPPRVYAGPCDCGMDLISQPGRTLVTCPLCHATYGIAERQEWMRSRLEDHLGTATYAAAILPGIGIHVTSGTIRMWASRGRLASHPGIPRPSGVPGPPTYRIGDIVTLALARDTARLRMARLAPAMFVAQDSGTHRELRPQRGALTMPGAAMRRRNLPAVRHCADGELPHAPLRVRLGRRRLRPRVLLAAAMATRPAHHMPVHQVPLPLPPGPLTMAGKVAGRSGGTWRKARARILQTSTTCWLCGHDGADSADHLIPRALCIATGQTELLNAVSNLAPAHHRPCPTCGQRCNRKRGTGQPQRKRSASRQW